MARVRFNVKTEIAKVLEKEGKRVVEMTQKDLNKLSREALEFAEKERKKAKYDGDPDDAIVYRDVSPSGKQWTITLSGPAAMSIEYGASDRLDYWYFSARGRNITLRAGGRPATYRRTLRSEGVRDVNPISKAESIIPYGSDVSQRRRDIRSFKWWNDPKYRGKYLGVKSQLDPDKKIKVSQKRDGSPGAVDEIVRKEGSFYTKGNPPNHIMDKTFKYLADGVDAMKKK